MPQVSGVTSEDSGSISTVFSGSASTTSQTFTFTTIQNAMTMRNKGASVLTLTVDGATYKIPPLATIEVDDKQFSSFDVKTESGSQTFELTSFALKSSGGGGEDTVARNQIQSLNAQLAERVKQLNEFKYTYSYYPDGYIQTITEKDVNDIVISTTTFTYLANGDVDTSVKVMDGITVSTKYNYDVNGNLQNTVNTKS